MFGETPRERSLFYLMMSQLALGFREGIISPILAPTSATFMKAAALRHLC